MESIVAIVGPTATGKTDLALRLAAGLGVEIVNADALQVYRGFDIGTAKPGGRARRAIPHHLLDILEADEPYSAGQFAERARQLLTEIGERGRIPLVVGGSGLYLRALFEGIGPLPPSQPRVRAALQERLASEGLEELWRELSRRDPATAGRLPPTDRQRILRALEVIELSGKPLSKWIAERPFGERPLRALKVGLTLPREVLYDRIASRVERMIHQGWLDEVSRLLAVWKDPDLPAFQAIGYRQLARHLLEGWPLEAAVDDIIRATRRYAKRQMTWFKRDAGIVWHRAEDLEAVAHSVISRTSPAPTPSRGA
ncbi:MAG: tRNA (adenosine(37)-N6)-dimethylallyltransferase MiaA [Thermoanaerobaculia bacterium]